MSGFVFSAIDKPHRREKGRAIKMYLHLGQSVVIPSHNVVGIFDLDNTTQSHLTRRFLEQAERSGKLESVGDELPKSFVVCQEKDGMRIYFSQISAATLLRRAEENRID